MANYRRLLVYIRTGKFPPKTRLEHFVEDIFIPACLAVSALLIVAIFAIVLIGRIYR